MVSRTWRNGFGLSAGRSPSRAHPTRARRSTWRCPPDPPVGYGCIQPAYSLEEGLSGWMPPEPDQLPGNLVAVPRPQGHDGPARYEVQAEQILRCRPPHKGLAFEAHVEDHDLGHFRP